MICLVVFGKQSMTLYASYFHPGTIISFQEPECPECGNTRAQAVMMLVHPIASVVFLGKNGLKTQFS